MNKIATSKQKMRVGFKGIVTKTDEELLEFSFSPRTYNFTFRGGVLKSDLGIDPAWGYIGDDLHLMHKYPPLPDGLDILNAFPYNRKSAGQRDDRIVVQASNKKLYYTKIFEIDVWHEIADSNFRGAACAVNYNYNNKDVLLLSSSESKMLILNGDVLTAVENAPRFNSLAVHYERIYGSVNKNGGEIWFSDDFNPENWVVSSTEGGYINFADEYGDVLKVVSFLNYLYIFREHAIFRLTAYGDQSEFSMKKLFTDTGRIYKPTIAVCGDKIVFLAEEGLFAFDGYNVSKIAKEIPDNYTPASAVGAFHNNKYYLACRILNDVFDYGVSVNNMLVEYDLDEKSISILAPVDVKELIPLNIHQATDLIVVGYRDFNGKLGIVNKYGRFFGEATKKYYFSPYNSLGTDKEKIVRSVTLTTKYDCTFKVNIDGVQTVYEFIGSASPQTVFVGRCGKRIQFILEAQTEDAYISPPLVSFETI